ncbi:hypothetical protein ASPACDRAFT_113605 [Aspergillus aculeatus ATCC 16872]|uniref:Uncharacterized protein n=1 Tax=Aspergillus aculeatus (strain ATCC 16872 / CBS 172.66 / WB 5094) TaxID=690307 RepID=A0A1L9X3F7_ASPA1|nr:uncharacterized protein ASPACDRAFT_113605 [Aspergillus aculeatus ATCC 16872]OJK03017.1 hypothetical protein ASPACDRAFT_113605 [Aspergillus aculeatus ATCC 16872]
MCKPAQPQPPRIEAGLYSTSYITLTHIPHACPCPGLCVGVLHSPSLETDKITDNKDFKQWIDKYLGVGEWVMDQSVAVLGSTSWFERRR